MKNNIGLILTLFTLGAIIVFQMALVLFPISLFPFIQYIYLAFIYLATLSLIFIERKNLEEFHIEKITLFMFIVSTLLRRRMGMDGEIYFLMIIALVGILTTMIVLRNRARIPGASLGWAVVGILVGCVALLPISFIASINFSLLQVPLTPGQHVLSSIPSLLAVLRQIIYFLSVSVPVEEILFRGFLWGYLQRLGWQEKRVFWVQAGVFWGLHLAQIVNPLNFFLALPISILASSVLRLRSKQVFPSILSHLVINTALSLSS